MEFLIASYSLLLLKLAYQNVKLNSGYLRKSKYFLSDRCTKILFQEIHLFDFLK